MTTPITTPFRDFAAGVVARHEDNLCDFGPEEQTARAVEALEKFHAHTPLTPVSGLMIDLFGFGSAQIHFESSEDRYMLLSELGAGLGVPIWEATKWARQQHLYALEDQREHDEERGDGRLGWECLRNYLDLGLWCVIVNQDHKPGTKGSISHYDFGEWLISVDRLMLFILDSPWAKEFQRNTSAIMRIGMQKFMSPALANLPVLRSDGSPALRDDGTPMAAADLWHTPLTEEEARRKARRGPNIPLDEPEEP